MLSDDRVGFFNERHDAPLGYQFLETGSVLHRNVEPEFDVDYYFDPLQFPYQFALAAAFDSGQLIT